MDFIYGQSPPLQALIATIFTWGMTALGASLVFVTKKPSERLLKSMLGFAGGVMIAASYWSLLAPSIEMSEGKSIVSWFPAALGFLGGSFFVLAIDRIVPHLHLGFPLEEKEGIETHLSRTSLLILAITLHNIPEGMAVGVAFGALSSDLSYATFLNAVALTIGIGIQNFPEGLAVSMPLRGEGISRLKSLWYGQLSGVVEPIAAVVGALAVTIFRPILPYALSFAAGAMIFVVIEEVIPESQLGHNTDLATVSALLGFVLMMVLDVALG